MEVEVALRQCQTMSSCTHMPSTHSAPLCYFNIGQMSAHQYQRFQMWISLESNSGKIEWHCSDKKVIFSQDLCASLLSFVVEIF